MPKSKLLFVGSSGCAFTPEIPCKAGKKKKVVRKKKDQRSKRVTKVMFRRAASDKELRMNRLVRRISGHEHWAITWDNNCMSPDYTKLEKISDMNKCIATKNKRRERKQTTRKSISKTSSRRRLLARSNKLTKQKNYQMFQGVYGGISAGEAMLHLFQETRYFSVPNIFVRTFISLFKALQPLFVGISELSKHGYCHNDLLSRNVLFDEKTHQFKMIDFGLSFDIKQTLKDINHFRLKNKPRYQWSELLQKKAKYTSQVFTRMTKELLNDRIYTAYPFDYLYFGIKEDEIEGEREDIAVGFNLIHYEDYYEFVHKGIFHRNIDKLRLEMLDNVMNLKVEDVLSKLDVYSLGMLVFELLIDVTDALIIPDTELLTCFKEQALKPYLALLRDMTEFVPSKRITAPEAHKRYMKLI